MVDNGQILFGLSPIKTIPRPNLIQNYPTIEPRQVEKAKDEISQPANFSTMQKERVREFILIKYWETKSFLTYQIVSGKYLSLHSFQSKTVNMRGNFPLLYLLPWVKKATCFQTKDCDKKDFIHNISLLERSEPGMFPHSCLM